MKFRNHLLAASSLAVFLTPLAAQVKTTPRPIAIEAYPVEGIDYDPLPAVFIVAPRGTVQETSIRLLNRKQEPLQILGLENPSSRFQARIQTVTEGKEYRLVVTLKGEGDGGTQKDIVLLKTNWSDHPLLKIPVNTRVQEKVYTFPQSVFMGRYALSDIRANEKAARGQAQILMVYRKGEPGFEAKFSSDVPFLRFDSELGPRGDQWETWIWVDPFKAQAGAYQGTIFIETNDPDIPKLSVPVNGNLLPK